MKKVKIRKTTIIRNKKENKKLKDYKIAIKRKSK